MKKSLKFAGLFAVLLFITGSSGIIYGREKKGFADFYLKNNDRVVFYGDSITEQSFYTNFIETYVVTRFPRLIVSFINSGWSGDWVVGGGGGKVEERLKRDVFAHKPTVMTAMFGMNDGCYVEFNADCFKVYTDGYEKLLTLLKSDLPGLRLTLLQPSPFDDWTDSHAWRLAPPVKGGYNSVMIRYGRFVRELAQKNKLGVADMNAPLVDVIQKVQLADRDQAQKIIPDRIHPGAAGGLIMAAAVLKAWNAPAEITSVEIDAANKKITGENQTKISDLKSGKDISWTQTDEALPLPINLNDKTIAAVARFSDADETLNRQMLKVTNLTAPRYTLKINGETMGTWTREELAAGVDLAPLATPMFKQAMKVYDLTEQHNKLHFARWREVQFPFENEALPGVSAALKSLDALEAELVKRQHAAAAPRAWQYLLTAQ